MKKYLFLILTLLLFGFSTSANTSFKPATLYLELPGFIVREAVYTKERADLLFSLGCKLEQGKMLGSTITTINSADLIKDSRAVINTNFTNLNTDKLERSAFFSTTTLPQITTMSNLATVGTITSGTWNGTAITVAKGGTGSTTLQIGQVLVGSSTNAISGIPDGTSGQLLTSRGVGYMPYWSSPTVDQTLNYNWTGGHIFNGYNTFYGNTGLGVATATSATIGSLSVTGNFTGGNYYVASTSNISIGASGNVYNVFGTTTIPSGTMGNYGAIKVTLNFTSVSMSGITVYLKAFLGGTLVASTTSSSITTTDGGSIVLHIQNTNSSSQVTSVISSNLGSLTESRSSSVNTAVDNSLYIQMWQSGGCTLTRTNAIVEVLKAN